MNAALDFTELAMLTPPAPTLLEPLARKLQDILQADLLTPRFQPILDLRSGEVHGFEGLIRGPSDSPLHSPLTLFRVARFVGLQAELEAACLRKILRASATGSQGKHERQRPAPLSQQTRHDDFSSTSGGAQCSASPRKRSEPGRCFIAGKGPLSPV